MKTNPLHKFTCFIFVLVLIASCGPGNVPAPQIYFQPNIIYGGRTLSVARNPSNDTNFMVVSDAGGLFRSFNTGKDWTQVSDSTTFGFTDVKFCSENPAIIIATASMDSKTTNGGGIWRSTDSGSSWTQVQLSPPSGSAAYLSAYCVENEKDANKMWAGTSLGLAYSTDKGTSWNFISPSANYNNDEVFAVLAPDKNRIIILTYEGVKVSTDGGANWTFSNTMLPGITGPYIHSQLACSPLNHNDIFWACQYYTSEGNFDVGMYASYDNGNSWTNVIDIQKMMNRQPICRTAMSIDGKPNDFDVYFSDGQFLLERGTFINGAIPTISGSWVNINVAHPDLSDLSFMKDNKTPVLLTGDGGIMSTKDKGSNWEMTGGGIHGYDALEVLSMTGQRHQNDPNSDLYFATWDNFIWASPDGGGTWPNSKFPEGYDLNISRSFLSASATKLTGVGCSACFNFMTDKLLANNVNFPDVPFCTGVPCLLLPGQYIESDSIPGSPDVNAFSLTTNTGNSWSLKYGFENNTPWLSTVVIDKGNPVIFTPVINTGVTMNGLPIVGLKKIVGVTEPGTPIVSDVTGFGSIANGIFGADIFDQNHLIIPDNISDSVKVTFDGGVSWATDVNLTKLVTESGKYLFENSEFAQITQISFDPTQRGHILVGTFQAGVFSTCDNGITWQLIPGTQLIPYITSFYFETENIVIVASAGRGLSKLFLPQCPPAPSVPISRIPHYQAEEPLIYWKGAMIPISQIHNPDACPVCGFYFVDGGEVSEVNLSEEDNIVSAVATTTGKLSGYSFDGKNTERTPFRVSKSDKKFNAESDTVLMGLLKKGFLVKGIYAEDNLFKGLLLSKKDISLSELPNVVELKSFVKAQLVYRRGEDKINGIKIRGKGFNKLSPLEVLVDRKEIDVKDAKPIFGENGIFTLYLDISFAPGRHTLLIEQKATNGIVRESTYFVIPSGDMR